MSQVDGESVDGNALRLSLMNARGVELWDLVAPKSPNNPLHSGSGRYSCAVVVSVVPFILVSEESDMRWSSTVKVEDYYPIGRAAPATCKRCERRRYS